MNELSSILPLRPLLTFLVQNDKKKIDNLFLLKNHQYVYAWYFPLTLKSVNDEWNTQNF